MPRDFSTCRRSQIQVCRLSKRYLLGDSSPNTIREAFHQAWHNITRSRQRLSELDRAGDQREFWALKDVSFEMPPGQILGIVGRNGSGKSTLLKILSRVTEPTEGRAIIRGKTSSLLEVGTGFHPDLTGRENIFLNGAIIGMRRQEIARQFNDIVAFAELERFIDTPVKRYSSGMYVRLAFAIAAHTNPDVLIIDEALAVGDTNFKRKCLQKSKRVAEDGKTVIFVSHDMEIVRQLCDRVLWLSHGVIKAEGRPAEIVSRYLASCDA